jgi:hypothetical protein
MKLRLIIGVFGAMAVGTVGADEPVKYEPTEIQSLRLQVRLKDVQLAQERYQVAVKDLLNEAAAIKVEQKWPKEVFFDAATMTFQPPKTVIKAADPKKP